MNFKNIGNKILQNTFTKIIVGMVVVLGFYGLSQYLVNVLLNFTTLSSENIKLITGVVSSIVALITYITLYRYYEKREITELSYKNFLSNILLGLLIGIILQSLTIFVIYLNGGYEIVSINPILNLIPALTMAFSSSIIEEILFRGIIFRITEEKLGSYIALLISAVIFGGLHYANPNSTVVAALGLAIQAGVLLGASYIYARSLWLPIGIHFAWNFTQSGIYGATVSGYSAEKSWISSEITGSTWYTGGEFGPEGSVQATIFCFIVALMFLYLSRKDNKIIEPIWKRKNKINNSYEIQNQNT